MKSILLVSTGVEWDVEMYEGIIGLPFLGVKAMVVPLHLATVAALTPDDIEVDIWDEPVHGRIDESIEFRKEYDLIGITGYVLHLERAKQIARIFRKRDIPVAIGGVGVSAAPETCKDDFDIIFVGEAELTWPEFISDWESGSYQRQYRQIAKPDLSISPIPKWDSIADVMNKYVMGAVQTTRGCPFDCEFCDVIYLHGRRPRYKPVDRILEEVSIQEKLGMKNVFFCDDNFIGNIRHAKELLRELISLNSSFENPLMFSTQLTLNVAKDDELLELLADAGFNVLFIGVETTNKESLLETGKMQNYRSDILEDVKKIQSYGMAIRAGMIVGFDHDDKSIFDEHYNFLQESGITLVSPHILRAPIGTRLWARLRKEGRIITDEKHDVYANLHGSNTNIIPKGMTRMELFSGYLTMMEKLMKWSSFEERVKRFISGVIRQPKLQPKGKKLSFKNKLKLFKYFFFSLDREARKSILRIIKYTRRNAPFLMGKIRTIIVMRLSLLKMLDQGCKTMRNRMELEKSEGFRLNIDQSKILIPQSFEEHYREIFPEIYQKVSDGLKDKSRIDVALVKIFTDFVVRWSDTLDFFNEQHEFFLSELTDRIIAEESCEEPQSNDQIIEKPINAELIDEVLKAVEQELRV
jgi:radical SAM superfamily enzyme YgiQ (UPF0313 family)